MNKSKDNKGITLITVIIAVVIVSIIAGVTTTSGIKAYKNAKVNNFISQMQIIQAKVDELVQNNEFSNLGSNLSEENQTIINNAKTNEEVLGNNNDFKYFSVTSSANLFDIENLDSPILINFRTREVVSVNGIEYKGKTYYTQYLLPGGQKLISYNRTPQQPNCSISKKMDGLNCTIIITDAIANATISYGKKENNQVSMWNTITNYSSPYEEYTINISKPGDYVFRIANNEAENFFDQNVSITVTNKPKTSNDVLSYDYNLDSSNWAYMVYRSDNYVWIPRFVYKENENTGENDILFIKGNSNITTEETYSDNSWTLPNIFNNGKTGIWVLTNIADNLDMIDLVSNENNTFKDEIISEPE